MNWDTFSATVFTDQKARDSGITHHDWQDSLARVGLDRVALQEAYQWQGRLEGQPVTYELTATPGQPGVIIVESACYAGWKESQDETDHEILLGQAFIECVLTDPDTYQHVLDRDPEAPDATLKVFLNQKDQDRENEEYQHGDDGEYLEAVLVRLNSTSDPAPDPQRLLRAVAQWAEGRAEDIGNRPEGPAGETLPPMFTMGPRPEPEQPA